jgi:hypothetical protein
MDHDPPAPPGIDPAVPSPARIWNYWLGGKDNFPADRAAAEETLAAMPSLAAAARLGRRVQADMVLDLVGRGVRQFLDIGTGLPVAGAVHEIAQRAAPESRVVYVDNDPMVLAHARALLTSSPQGACDYLTADLRDPDAILAHAAKTLDLARPVAIILIAVLHFIPDAEDPWAITARLLDGIAGEAYLAIGHGAADLSASAGGAARAYNERSPANVRLRTREEVARFFTGMQMLGPGLVPLAGWAPGGTEGMGPDADLGSAYVGFARRPAKA